MTMNHMIAVFARVQPKTGVTRHPHARRHFINPSNASAPLSSDTWQRRVFGLDLGRFR